MSLLVATATLAADHGHVSAITAPAGGYLPDGSGRPTRAAVAQSFFGTHGDGYDFLVVFPTFQTGFTEQRGLHTQVRGDTQGIGATVYDDGATFGSASRLKAYLDVRALDSPATPPSVDEALRIVAHEVAHQWVAYPTFRDAGGQSSSALLGRDLTHWSFFLDSDGSLLYGSDWVEGPAGAWTAQESHKRFSSLDLYLMGLAIPAEVPPMSLLRPAPGATYAATDIPPPDGTTIVASAETVTIESIVAANGPRVPDAAHSQKSFRAAFILLLPPGQSTPTPTQVAFVDTVRRRFANEFFFLTRGRAVMETDLLEVPAEPLSSSPDILRGVDFLLSRQESTGLWLDTPGTTIRDSQLALEALALFGGDARVPPALQTGGSALSQSAVDGVDAAARRALGLVASHQPASSVAAVLDAHVDRTSLNSDFGYGYTRGYASTVLDSVLAAEAHLASGTPGGELTGLIGYLVGRQNPDGGWPYGAAGESRLAVTSLVLLALRDGPQSEATALAAAKGNAFLRTQRRSDGSFGEPGHAIGTTALAVLALDEWKQLSPAEAFSAAAFLLGRQWTNGSFGGTVAETALALKALPMLRTPNLSLVASDITGSGTQVLDGAQLRLAVTIRNTSHADSPATTVQAFDSSGTPFGAEVQVPPILAGSSATVDMVLDTTGHGGSTQLFVAVDPGGAVNETLEDDNRAALPLFVVPPPTEPELTVHSLLVTAPGLTSIPGSVTVTAAVDNVGLTEAQGVFVELRVGGASTRTQITLGPRTSTAVQLTVPVTQLSLPLTATVQVDPDNAIAEPDETNNQATVGVPIAPTVDVAVSGLVAGAQAVSQGQSVTVSFVLSNSGTADAADATVTIRLRDGAGALVETLTTVAVPVVAGGLVPTSLIVRPTHAGSLTLEVTALASADGNLANNTQGTGIVVSASMLANLVVLPGQLSVTPSPLLEGKPGTVTAIVSNTGATAATNVAVEVWSGAPPSGTRLAREVVQLIEPGSTAPVTSSITPSSTASIDLVTVVDADGTVSEYDEADNLTVLRVTPRSLPDLSLADGDIRPQTASPAEGVLLPVTVFVRNLGQQEALAPVVTLYLGDAITGQVVGTQTLPAVLGGEEAQATFSLQTAGLSGALTLTATVATSSAESRADNNQSATQLRVQTGPVSVTNLYFSPNGDGVKDDTTAVVNQAVAAPLEMVVTDDEGATVRTLTSPAATTAQLAWDGRQEDGRIARDGIYLLQVFSGAGSAVGLLGSVSVTLDTNRSSVAAAAGTPLLRAVDLSPLISLDSNVVPSLDDTGTIVVSRGYSVSLPNQPPLPCGFYLQQLPGQGDGEPLLVSPPSVDCDYTYSITSDLVASPSRQQVAFMTWQGLSLLDIPSRSIRVLATDTDLQGRNAVAPWFSPTGDEIRYWKYDSGVAALRLAQVRYDGTGRRDLSVLADLQGMEVPISDATASPDGTQIAWLSREDRSLMAGPLGGPFTVLLPSPPLYGQHWGLSFWRQVAWLSNTEVVRAVGSGSNIEVANTTTGAVRTLLAEPRTGVGFSADGRAMATMSEPSVGRVDWGGNEALWDTADGVLLSAPVGRPTQTTPLTPASFREGATINFSPQGSFLYSGRGRAIVTLANLTNAFTARRGFGESAFSFNGTETDLNFEAFEVAVSPYRSTASPTVVARGATAAVDGTFAQWVPSGPGLFDVRVTARDLAGNARTRVTQVASPDTSVVVSNIQRSPEVFSPNGDGRKDVTTLTYETSGPTTLDVTVTAADGGATVRRMSSTALSAGSGSVDWDGRDDFGLGVQDGDYRISAEGALESVSVDTTPPAVALDWNHQGSGETRMFQRESALGYGFVPCPEFPSNGIFTEQYSVPLVAALFRFSATDGNPGSWKLEASAPHVTTGFGTIATGTDTSQHTDSILLQQLRGRSLRISAEDQGGNRASTTASAPAEHLFVVGASEGGYCARLPGGLLVPGWPLKSIIPPTRDVGVFVETPPMAPAVVRWNHFGGPSSTRELWVALANSITEPIQSVTASVTSPTASLSIPPAHTTNPHSIRIDTSSLTRPETLVVALTATTTSGRTFNSTLTIFPGNEVETVCATQDKGTIQFDLPQRTPGGILSPVVRGTATFIRDDGGGPSTMLQFGRSLSVSTQTLETCHYTADIHFTHENGAEGRAVFSGTDVCRVYVDAVSVNQGVLTTTVSEDLHDLIVDGYDLYTREWEDGAPTGAWILRGNHPGFQGTGTLTTRLRPEDGCRNLQVRVIARPSDGASYDSASASPLACEPPDPGLLGTGCRSLIAQAPERTTTSPWCSAQSPTWIVRAEANGPLASLTAELYPLVGQPRSMQPITFTPGTSTGVAIVDTAPLVDGRYLVSFRATEGAGSEASVAIDEASAIVVDTAPPSATLLAPVSGAVCPTPRRNFDGSLNHVFDVSGVVTDENPERWAVLLRSTGQALPQPVYESALQTAGGAAVSATIKADGIPSGEYELFLGARDVSGGSTCTPSAIVRLAQPISVTQAAPTAPILISPDGDGIAETTAVSLALNTPGQVSLEVHRGASSLGAATSVSLAAGGHSLPWAGTAGGLRVADGAYRLEAVARDECGNTSRQLMAEVVEVDTTFPVAQIDLPTPGADVQAAVSIVGTASDLHFLSYEVDIGAGAAPSAWVPITTSGTPVSSGPLALVDVSNYSPGLYTVRLIASDAAGHAETTLLPINIQPTASLVAFDVQPGLISPDGDGILDDASAFVTLRGQAAVTVEVLSAGTVIYTLLAGTTQPTGTTAYPFPPGALAGLGDGRFDVRATVGSDTATVSLELDTQAPQVTISLPSGAAVPGRTAVQVAVADPHLSAWELRHTTPSGAVAILASGTTPPAALPDLVGLADGSHRLELQASDSVGHTQTASTTFTSDNTPPVVAFRTPHSDSILSGLRGAVPVEANIIEDSVASIVLDWAPTTGVRHNVATLSTLPPSGLLAAWDVAAETDGPGQLFLVVTDTAGNSSDAVINLVLDSTPPAVGVTSPSAGLTRTWSSVAGSVEDAHLSSWEVTLGEGAPGASSNFVTIGSGSSPVTSGTLAQLSGAAADGVRTLRVRAVDAAANETLVEVRVEVDATPPDAATALSAAVQRPSDVALAWTASTSPDVVGYLIYRASAGTALLAITQQAVAGASYVDPGLSDGTYRYVVRAVDAAGNESAPSNEAAVSVDATPPEALLSSPAPAAVLGGVVAVRGTAYSLDDFREYRLLIGSGQTPASLSLVSRGTLPIRNGQLGEVDTSALPQGSVQTLVLEAEDLSGNVSSARVTFVTDNAAPPAPLLTSATVSQRTATVTWQAVSASDLRGYLVYRNGAIANAPAGQSMVDFAAFLVPGGTTTFTDVDLPDGTHTWHVQAADEALNLSALSNGLSASVELRAPAAVVVAPAHLSRIGGATTLLAGAVDEDIAQVQFEVRAHPAAGFVPVGAPRTAAPFLATFDPSLFAGASVFEVRAVATDRTGNVDPAPASSFFFLDAPPAQPQVTTSVDGATVTIAWASQAAAFEVFGENHFGPYPVLPWPGYLTGQATATSSAAGNQASNGVDGNSSSSWRALPGYPQDWEVVFTQPAFVETISANVLSGANVEISMRVAGVWIPMAPAQVAEFGNAQYSSAEPLLAEGLRLRFLAGAAPAQVWEVYIQSLATVTAPPAVDSYVSLGLHPYVVRARSRFGAVAEGRAEATVFQPVLNQPASPVATASIVVAGHDATPGARVDFAVNGANVAQTTADAAGAFSTSVPLVAGGNAIEALATDAQGNRSLPSNSVWVDYAAPPSAAVALALDTVVGSSVQLSFSVAGSGADVTGFEVRRTTNGTTTVVATLQALDRAITNTLVPNGPSTYVVVPFNANGHFGVPSNSVTATVAVPLLAAPVLTAVNAPPEGGSLDVAWTHQGGAATFAVQWAPSAAGPFVEAARTSNAALRDSGRTNGVAVFYRVLALDGAGNASAPSNILGGTPLDALAPEPPSLRRPTTPGLPVTVAGTHSTVGGDAELNALVELLRNGQSQGVIRASTPTLAVTPIGTVAPAYAASISPARDRIAYFRAASGANYELVVQSMATQQVTVFATPSGAQFSYPSAPIWAPDGTRLAVSGRWTADSSERIFLGDLALGTLSRFPSTERRYESSPSFSPDSRKLAYQSSWFDSRVVVQDVVAGSSDVSPPSFGAPAWAAGGGVFAKTGNAQGGTDVVLLEPGTWTATVVWASPDAVDRIRPAPGGRWLATVVNRLPNWDAVAVDLVDLSSGTASRVALGDAPGGSSINNLTWAPDNSTFSYTLDDVLFRARPGSAAESMGVVDVLRIEHLSASEYFVEGTTGPGVAKVAGRFDFPNIQLAQGLNGFFAVARDDSGNESTPSSLILVTSSPGAPVDLSVTLALQPPVVAEGGVLTAVVAVANRGPASAANPEVAVTVTTADGGIQQLAPVVVPATLGAGDTASVTVRVPTQGLSGGGHAVIAVVDPSRRLSDTNLSNNTASASFSVATSGPPVVALALGASELSAADSTIVTVTATNPGPSTPLSAQVRLLDAAGATVSNLGPAEAYSPLASGSTATFTRTVSAAGLLPGDYVVEVLGTDGLAVISRATASLRILTDRATRVSLVSTRAIWQPGDTVTLEATVHNDSANASLAGASLALVVADGGGASVQTETRGIATLPPGASQLVTFVMPASALGAGAFVATATVVLANSTLATSATPVAVAGAALLAGSVTPAGVGSPPSARQGQPASVDVGIQNLGTASSASLSATVSFTHLQTGAVAATAAVPVGALPAGGRFQGNVAPNTATWALGTYAVALVVDDGVQPRTLASSWLRLVDGTAPVVSIVSPAAGALVSGSPVLQVRAMDDASGVASVGLTLDGTTAIALLLTNGTSLDGTWAAQLPPLGDGPHLLQVLAFDTEGNSAPPLNLSVIVDSLPPVIVLTGVQDGVFYGAPVSPAWTVTDVNPTTTEALLDGQPFAPGTVVGGEGVHRLDVLATDAAGNTSRASATFEVDTRAPTLSLAGVFDGMVSAQTVVPFASASDANLASFVLTMNGAPFVSGTPIAAEGEYLLAAVATDTVGHTQSLSASFAIDRTPPVIALGGFVEGQATMATVTPTVDVTDAHLAAVVTTLNGLPFVSGTPVAAEGGYTLLVVAVDAAGNRTEATSHFTVDRTPPAVSILGVTPGQVSRLPLTPTVQTEAGATLVALLNGLPFISGTPVATEGPHTVDASATDAAGNVATARVTFAIDTTPPAIVLGGFVEGVVVSATVSPTFTITDPHLAAVTATLNGQPFVSGTPVVADGPYALVILATDSAGNTSNAAGTFIIDTAAPVITIAGVTAGQVSALAVTPTVTVTDANLASSTALLNGAPFVSGTTVAVDGDYLLQVTATDDAGNSSSQDVAFSVDTAPPTITVTGVANGAQYGSAVTPQVSFVDAHLASSTLTLDGATFISGTPVTQDGSYTLEASATDAAGHSASLTVRFTIQGQAPGFQVTKGLLGASTRTLALLRTGSCVAAPADMARLEGFLAASLGGPLRVLLTTNDESTFLRELRGGAFNVYVLVDVELPGHCGGGDDDGDDDDDEGGGCGGRGRSRGEHRDGRGGDDDDDDDDDEHHGGSGGGHHSESRRRAIAEELTEQVYGGHAGLVLVQNATSVRLDLREVTGLSFDGRVQSTTAAFTAGPLAASPPLSFSGRALELKLKSATSAAVYGTGHRSRDDAAASAAFGLGRAVTFGFDLTSAAPGLDAQAALATSAAWVTPPPGSPDALSVVGLQVSVANTGGAVQALIQEMLQAPLLAVNALPAATVSAQGRQLDWQIPLGAGQSVSLAYWLRLPDSVGTWTATTDIATVLGGVPTPSGSWPFSVSSTRDGAGLLTGARTSALQLSTHGQTGSRRAAILTRLSRVQGRAIVGRSDIEDNLEDLLEAAQKAGSVSGSAGIPVRQSLDTLIRYWEARWYVY